MTYFCFQLCSRAPPKSSSPDAVKQQAASQSETGQCCAFHLDPPVFFFFCFYFAHHSHALMFPLHASVHAQGRATENTAAPKSTSITAASPGRTSTRDASPSSLSSSARGTVSSYSKRWGWEWRRRRGSRRVRLRFRLHNNSCGSIMGVFPHHLKAVMQIEQTRSTTRTLTMSCGESFGVSFFAAPALSICSWGTRVLFLRGRLQ